jgi:hypothetical protein
VNIPHYISELLVKHDCVVVPAFGAFVASYAPAKVNPSQHTFHPPSKQVVFNKHLQQNDGLLAQTIVDESKCTFDEAMNGIRHFVDGVNRKLKAGEKAEFHNVGILSMDSNGTISFDAAADVNYLLTSFGLSSFQSLPVIRENAIEKKKPIVREDRVLAEEKLTPEKVVEVVRTRSRGRGVLITSAVVLPLLVAGLWFTSVKTNALAGFWFFKSNSPAKYHLPSKFTFTFSSPVTEELKPDGSGIAHFTLNENAPDIVVNIHKVVPDSTLVARSNALKLQGGTNFNGGRYYVIAGAFAVPENVTKFIKSLHNKGIDAQVVERAGSKLTHVGIGSFESKADAERFMSKVSADVPGVWILKK